MTSAREMTDAALAGFVDALLFRAVKGTSPFTGETIYTYFGEILSDDQVIEILSEPGRRRELGKVREAIKQRRVDRLAFVRRHRTRRCIKRAFNALGGAW